jgi:hypothetical protein
MAIAHPRLAKRQTSFGHHGIQSRGCAGQTFVHLLIASRRPRRESQCSHFTSSAPRLAGSREAVPSEPPSLTHNDFAGDLFACLDRPRDGRHHTLRLLAEFLEGLVELLDLLFVSFRWVLEALGQVLVRRLEKLDLPIKPAQRPAHRPGPQIWPTDLAHRQRQAAAVMPDPNESSQLCPVALLSSQSKFVQHEIALTLRRRKPLQHVEQVATRAGGVRAHLLYVTKMDKKLLRAQLKKAYFVFEFAHGCNLRLC